jgi:hypothetical protein
MVNKTNTSSTEFPIFERFKVNYLEFDNLEYFSMINEAVTCLAIPLAKRGYILNESTFVDISFGLGFCTYLRKNESIEPNDICKTYSHIYCDGRIIEGAKLYPLHLKPIFINWFKNDWLENKAEQYLIKKEGHKIIKPLYEYINDLKNYKL